MWVASERQPGLGVVLDILDEDGQLADDLSRFAARVCYLMWGAHTLLSMFVDIHQWVANNLTSGARRRGRGTPLRGVLHGCMQADGRGLKNPSSCSLFLTSPLCLEGRLARPSQMFM
jgi:hypothetical protein